MPRTKSARNTTTPTLNKFFTAKPRSQETWTGGYRNYRSQIADGQVAAGVLIADPQLSLSRSLALTCTGAVPWLIRIGALVTLAPAGMSGLSSREAHQGCLRPSVFLISMYR